MPRCASPWLISVNDLRAAEDALKDLKNIKLIFDLDDLAALIRQHLPGDFANPKHFPDSNTPVEQRLAEQFMFVYNKWKKDGEPPDVAIEKDTAPEDNELADNADDEHEA